MAFNLKYQGVSIDQVILKLDKIIAWGISQKNRNAYFAALYRNITFRVKHAIQNNQFEDGERMERFIVIFADFYIDAYERYIAGQLGDENPWLAIFKEGRRKRTIAQHLLLGVNVHINFDLPSTCYQIIPGKEMIILANDYVRINTILYEAVKDVEKQISCLSPILGLVIKVMPEFERTMLNFSLSVARAKSWECACRQAISDEQGRARVVAGSLEMTRELCRRILKPGFLASLMVFFIGLTEYKGIKASLSVLCGSSEY